MSEPKSVRVGVVGAGPFGRGLASTAARRGSDVVLWSRQKRDPGDARISVTSDLERLADRELILLAVPTEFAYGLLPKMSQAIDGAHTVVHVTRALADSELHTMSHLIRETTSVRRIGALAGPLSGAALAAGEPAGGVVGTDFPEVALLLRQAIGGPRLRIYDTRDVIGVELASALGGMLLFALGYATGSGVDPSMVGVLAARGLRETSRIGQILGAQDATFSGLACAGDIMATLAGEVRPEFELGKAFAKGVSLEVALRDVGGRVEATAVAKHVIGFGERISEEFAIAAALQAVLDGASGEVVLERLMARSVGTE